MAWEGLARGEEEMELFGKGEVSFSAIEEKERGRPALLDGWMDGWGWAYYCLTRMGGSMAR